VTKSKWILGALLVGSIVSCGQSVQQPEAEAQLQVDVLASMTGTPKQVTKLGALDVTVPVSATIDAALANQIVNSETVTLQFSNGEVFGYQNIDGLAVVDGDVIYARSVAMPDLMAGYQTHVNNGLDVEGPSAQSTIGKRGRICTFRVLFCWAGFQNQPAWPGKKIYFQFGQSLNTDNQGDIMLAVQKWNQDTNNAPQWINGRNPNGTTTTFVKLPRSLGNLFQFSGLSPVGYTQQQALPYIYIVDTFFNTNNITHEMGHAAGLNHEHQRCDRDRYLNINVSFFQRYVNFINWSPICNWGEDIGQFNYDSIMMYRPDTVTPKDSATGYRGDPNLFNSDTRKDSALGLNIGDVQDGLKALYP
jgi:hypothetical protein